MSKEAPSNKGRSQRFLTQEEKAEIRDLYLNKGYGRWRVARLMHMCINTIDQVVRGEGLERTPREALIARGRGLRAIDFTQEEVNDICNRYESGWSMYSLRKEYNVSNEPLMSLLSSRGIEFRGREEAKKMQKKKSIIKKIAELQQQLEESY